MNDIPPTIYVAIAAVIAALISAAISLINIIISKDQKISEFRQGWIDNFRSDIAEFIANVSTLADLIDLKADIQQKRRNKDESKEAKEAEEVLSFYESKFGGTVVGMKTLIHRIQLRANPKEHAVLLERLNKLQNMFTKLYFRQDEDAFYGLQKDVIDESQSILKKEWKRVKRGEFSYRIVKYVSLLVLLFSLVFVFLYSKEWITIKFQ